MVGGGLGVPFTAGVGEAIVEERGLSECGACSVEDELLAVGVVGVAFDDLACLVGEGGDAVEVVGVVVVDRRRAVVRRAEAR